MHRLKYDLKIEQKLIYLSMYFIQLLASHFLVRFLKLDYVDSQFQAYLNTLKQYFCLQYNLIVYKFRLESRSEKFSTWPKNDRQRDNNSHSDEHTKVAVNFC